jgi:diacylglycerol kinase (ATP)
MGTHRGPLIIVNNSAARANRAWPTIQAKLRASRIDFDVYHTSGPGDATNRTRTALKNGYQTIAVVGGDGTLSEAAAGFFEFDQQTGSAGELPVVINPEASLAILPAGTGDDFARGLTGKRAPLEKWIEVFVAHCLSRQSTRAVDMIFGRSDGYTRPFVCINAATLGIGGETAARVAAQGGLLRKFSGEIRFVIGACGALAAWRERRVRVLIDEHKVIDCPMNLLVVANSLYAGGGMMFSPKAQIDDGELDIVTACGLTRAMVVRELPRIHSGSHLANPKVQITLATRVRVETFAPQDAMQIEADGNLRGCTPAEFRIMPRALRFVSSKQ